MIKSLILDSETTGIPTPPSFARGTLERRQDGAVTVDAGRGLACLAGDSPKDCRLRVGPGTRMPWSIGGGSVHGDYIVLDFVFQAISRAAPVGPVLWPDPGRPARGPSRALEDTQALLSSFCVWRAACGLRHVASRDLF